MKKLCLVVSFLSLGAFLFADGVVVKVEAESFVKEEKGSVVKVNGRPETSGGVCLTTWNNKDHVLEWDVVIPKDGMYKVAFRYANGRKWTIYRDMQIDGKFPSADFQKITMESTGGFSKSSNDWRNLTVGSPALVKLSKGTHHIKMTNLGGDGGDGACNFDVIGFMDKDTDVSVLGK